MTVHLLNIVRLALGIMFAVSAAYKVADPRSFSRGVRDYKIIPNRGIVPFVTVVVVSEVFLALSHLCGWWLAFSSPLGLTLLGSFFVAITINLKKHHSLPCFCFGAGDGEIISRRSLIRLGIAILSEALLLVQTASITGPTRGLLADSARDLMLDLTWALFALLACIWALSLPEVLDITRHALLGLTRGDSRQS